MEGSDMAAKHSDGLKEYVCPEVRLLGSVRDLTNGGVTPVTDSGGVVPVGSA